MFCETQCTLHKFPRFLLYHANSSIWVSSLANFCSNHTISDPIIICTPFLAKLQVFQILLLHIFQVKCFSVTLTFSQPINLSHFNSASVSFSGCGQHVDTLTAKIHNKLSAAWNPIEPGFSYEILCIQPSVSPFLSTF